MPYRNRVEVSRAALRHNVGLARRLAGERGLIAVVKADGYGLGLERCAVIHHRAGARAIAVASLGEAERVRAVLPEARVVVFGAYLDDERRRLVEQGFDACCSSSEEALAFAALAEPDRPQALHCFVDTGMGRLGCAPEAAPELLSLILRTPTLHLAGVATHYPAAIDTVFSQAQEERFQAVLDAAPPLPAGTWIHSANSEALLARREQTSGDTVRPGLLLTGTVPEGCSDPGLRPALRWLSSVALLRRLPAGHGVSYARTHLLERDTLVALVPVGYADGYPVALSNRGWVLIQGRPCPVLGRVTMDYLVIDCDQLSRPPSLGERVVLLGNDGEQRITVNDLARAADTIPYEVLTGLHGRCEIHGVEDFDESASPDSA